jgi:hypothetical protein
MASEGTRQRQEQMRQAAEKARVAGEKARLEAERTRHEAVGILRATAQSLQTSLEKMTDVEGMRRLLAELRNAPTRDTH